MVNAQKVVDEMRQVILDNIDDPNPRRGSDNDNWVQTASIELSGHHPKIFLEVNGGPRQPHGTNNTDRVAGDRIQVSVWWDINNEWNVTDDEGKDRPEVCLEWLTEQIETSCNGAQTRYQDIDNDVRHVLSDNVERVPTSRDDLIKNVIDFIITHRR